MEFGILGPLQLTRDDMPVAVPGRVLPRLLAVLLLEAGHVVPRDRLIDAVWEDEPPATAVRQIFNTVSTARGLLLDSDTAEIEKIGEDTGSPPASSSSMRCASSRWCAWPASRSPPPNRRLPWRACATRWAVAGTGAGRDDRGDHRGRGAPVERGAGRRA
ncbi:hypothetical protein GCM10029992_37140 [Glycomyces albus]